MTITRKKDFLMINILHKKKKSKYKNKKCVVNDIKFDSIMEADFYLTLRHQEKLGVVKILELQPKVYLSKAKILYKPDFLIKRIKENKLVYIDVKGAKTALFKLKARLWKAYMNYNLELITRKGRHFTLIDTIEGMNNEK